ncbi:MAG: PHP domain-containing protein [Candidatus Melainabacteria bacterium]|nr:PHP domain-containing protein [Candidatus Melainabacteria bacterium]
MDKFEIANALRETGALISAAGGNPYKARAYITGAKSVESLQRDIGTLVAEKRLVEVPGIGASLAAAIEELYITGTSRVLTRLKEEMPPGIIELSNVPGLTTKRIQAIHDALGVKSIDELEAACLAGTLRSVKGFGEKLEKTILEGINSYRTKQHQVLLHEARRLGNEIVAYLKPSLEGNHVEIAGEIRRWYESVNCVQIVAEAENRNKAIKSFKKLPMVTEVEEERTDYVRVRLADGMRAELFLADCFATKLIEVTGSDAHFQRLQRHAADQGFELTGQGLSKDANEIDVRTEKSVYKTIGLNLIPPEMREDLGEVEDASASDFSDLIQIEDIRGMTHCHTTFSDGRHTVEEMARAAEKMGMQYLTITDHSPLAHYAGGLTIDDLKQQWDEIDRVQEIVDIKLLKGTECDILADGKLDYPDAILERFDLIIASVHSRFKLDEKQMTTRLLNCMKNSHFKIWGHPLGRLVLRRDPIACDVEKVLDAVAESKAAIEINGDPHRLDLEPRWARAARERGIKFVISTDAHSTGDYRNLKYGIHMARRAGIKRKDVLNTRSHDDFKSSVKP